MTEVGVPEAGLAALHERHYLALVRLALHLVDDLDSAEDVVQDVFAGLNRKSLPPDPLPYLRTAVINRSRSMLRRRRVARAFGARAARVELVESADEPALRADRRARIVAALATLPGRQREVVVLRYYEDLRVAEIAAALGISPAAVSTSLARALDRLADLTGDDDAR